MLKLIRTSEYRNLCDVRIFNNKKWISRKSFQLFLNAQDDFEYRRRIFGNLTTTTDNEGRVVIYFKDNQFKSSKYSINITQFYDKWIPIVLAKTSSSVTLQIYSFSGNPMPNVEITMSVDINGVTY